MKIEKGHLDYHPFLPYRFKLTANILQLYEICISEMTHKHRKPPHQMSPYASNYIVFFTIDIIFIIRVEISLLLRGSEAAHSKSSKVTLTPLQ